jgi:hypothetical protein
MSKQFLKKFGTKNGYVGVLWCLFLILVAGRLAAFGGAQALDLDTRDTLREPKKEGQSSFPKIIIDEKVFDFQPIYEGKPIVHTFIVKNAGSGVLVIEKVKPS